MHQPKKPTDSPLTIGWVSVEDAPLGFAAMDGSPFFEDDLTGIHALEKKGHKIVPIDWKNAAPTAEALKAKGVDLLLVRIPQFQGFIPYRMPQFLDWLETMEKAGIKVANPVSVCRWNTDKHYLLDLEKAGVPIVPSQFVEPGEEADIARIMRDKGWKDVVVKPQQSYGGIGVERVRGIDASPAGSDDPNAAQYNDRFNELVNHQKRGMIVSEYRPEIAQGEWSFVFFNGVYDHAVRKVPAQGNFLVQPSHGGTTNVAQEPSRALVAQAEKMMKSIQKAYADKHGSPCPPCLYGRVDCVETKAEEGSQLKLMEMELFDPVLYFGKDTDKTVTNFAKAARNYSQSKSPEPRR